MHIRHFVFFFFFVCVCVCLRRVSFRGFSQPKMDSLCGGLQTLLARMLHVFSFSYRACVSKTRYVPLFFIFASIHTDVQ